MLQVNYRSDFSGNHGRVLSIWNPVHFKNVTVLSYDGVCLTRIALLGNHERLNKYIILAEIVVCIFYFALLPLDHHAWETFQILHWPVSPEDPACASRNCRSLQVNIEYECEASFLIIN